MMLCSTFYDCTLSANQVRGCEPKANGCRPGAGLRASNCQWGCSWLWLLLDERISYLPPITYYMILLLKLRMVSLSLASHSGTPYPLVRNKCFHSIAPTDSATIRLVVSTFPMAANHRLSRRSTSLSVWLLRPLAPAPPPLHFPTTF